MAGLVPSAIQPCPYWPRHARPRLCAPPPQVHANCRIRRIYFADRLYSEAELPPEFKVRRGGLEGLDGKKAWADGVEGG